MHAALVDNPIAQEMLIVLEREQGFRIVGMWIRDKREQEGLPFLQAIFYVAPVVEDPVAAVRRRNSQFTLNDIADYMNNLQGQLALGLGLEPGIQKGGSDYATSYHPEGELLVPGAITLEKGILCGHICLYPNKRLAQEAFLSARTYWNPTFFDTTREAVLGDPNAEGINRRRLVTSARRA